MRNLSILCQAELNREQLTLFILFLESPVLGQDSGIQERV